MGAAAALLAVFLSGDRADASEDRAHAGAAASYRWPTETLRDWVDFADQVSVLRVTAERKLPPTEDVVENGEGYLGRSITAVVESTVWRYPGSPRAGDVVSMRDWGWAVGDGKLTPMVDSDSIRLEVGDRVLAALLRTPEGEWATVNPATAYRLRNGRTALAPRQKRARRALVLAVDGKTPVEIAAHLDETTPSADRGYLRSLDPDARRRYLNDR